MRFKNSSVSDIIVCVLFALVLLASIIYFRASKEWIGKEFPGFITYENKIIGLYNQPEWEGPKRGIRARDFLKEEVELNHFVFRRTNSTEALIQIPPQVFTFDSFIEIAAVPFFSGVIFCVLALITYWVMRFQTGAFPFFLFNLGSGYFIMSSFDFQSSYHLSWLFLLNFCFMPAHMSHFALVFPEPPEIIKSKFYLKYTPYLISLGLSIPYVYNFYKAPAQWPEWEKIVVAYAAISYTFWLMRLGRTTNSPQNEMNRIIAKYLFMGQILAFSVPFFFSIYAYIFQGEMPLNWVAPLTVFFPIASLFGITLAKLKKTQMELIQSEKMASLGQMLSGIAHEINNPMTFIASNIEPLRKYIHYLKSFPHNRDKKFKNEMSPHEVFADLDSLINNIREGTDRTAEIIGDLRRFGHSMEDVKSSVNLLESTQGVINILKQVWDDRIRIHVYCDPDLTFNANPGQISQLLINLTNNAIQSIEQKGDIWINIEKDSHGLKISVKDTGSGMAPQTLKKIFDPFYTTKPQGLGTGLGLSIVQQIVNQMKGKIDVKSEVRKGTEFLVRLPR